MNYKPSTLLSLLFVSLVLFLSACQDDPKLPDNELEFESSVAGISSEDESLTININLSRPAASDVTVNISLNPGTLQYGIDFTTSPAAVVNVISVTIPEAETQATLMLTKIEGVGFAGDETMVFSLTDVDGSAVIGTVQEIAVTFSEITIENASMNIQGGGPTFPNRVFIDLSANRQTTANRNNWDFGFYTAAEEFRVILNSSLSMLAKPLDKTTLISVTAADTVGFTESLTIDAFSTANLPFIDNPSGVITGTAIAAISATEAENKVYIVNRGIDVSGAQRSWKKVRVLRNGTGYVIQHADITSATFQTINVTPDIKYLFNYVNLNDNAVVQPEPEKGKWDIAYTTFINQTNLGEGFVPYIFNDFMIQNRNGVEAVQVLNSAGVLYADFDAADLTGIVFGANQNTIGSSWRNGGGPTTAPSLRTDRFYLIKDADGNIYKLKFTALTQDGERGRPAVEYALLSSGD